MQPAGSCGLVLLTIIPPGISNKLELIFIELCEITKSAYSKCSLLLGKLCNIVVGLKKHGKTSCGAHL
jgi:hypothetical protein